MGEVFMRDVNIVEKVSFIWKGSGAQGLSRHYSQDIARVVVISRLDWLKCLIRSSVTWVLAGFTS